MNSYIEDILIKCRCCACGSDFILSEYQMGSSDKKVACPYCHKEDIKELMRYDHNDRTIDIPGCMRIGHHTNIEEQKENYEYSWGQVIQLKIDKLKNEIDLLNKCKSLYEL